MMHKILKPVLFIVLAIIIIPLLFLGGVFLNNYIKVSNFNSELHSDLERIEIDGKTYRDLNKNGKLDIYEDPNQEIDDRIENLISQMNLDEKAGLMFIHMTPMGNDGSLVKNISFSNPFTLFLDTHFKAVVGKKMNHFNTLDNLSARSMAIFNNNIQELAERTRLGIPVTIATDPRHMYGYNPGANVATDAFSDWPSPLGLGAIGDSALVREFADIARQEYLSVGIRLALHPMADLATEPRWARINGTFGEDAELSAKLTEAYILGFQGDSLGTHSVATMSKHFSGGGPQKEGEDAHFAYGADQAYPGNNFDYHLIPFEKGVFPAGSAQIMPYYGVPVGQTNEDVGFAFNKYVITDLLRNKYGFDGVVCTDWGLVTDSKVLGVFPLMDARAWGVEQLTPLQRAQKIIEAGCDQFGGESAPELIIELVESGVISEERIDKSVYRILRDKFRLGLFDNPYVDVDATESITGIEEFRAKGFEAQKRSIILLKNDSINKKAQLPLEQSLKVFFDNIDPEVGAKYANVAETVEEADVILTRISTPFEQRNGDFLESYFHQGSLEFTAQKKDSILTLINQKPSIVGIYLDRGAVIPEISDASHGLLAEFGVSDEAFLDVVFGKFSPTGKLPIELPSSMEAVRNQSEDLPHDSENPLYPFGYGLSY